MKLHQLEALVASADAGSIRAAARMLGLSQPAVTRALRELESEQKLQLLQRSPTGLKFTEHGIALLTHARLILNQMRQAESQMSIRRGEIEGRLCVGVTPWLSLTLLPEVVTSFRKRMPNVRLELFDSFVMITQPLLRDGYMDLAIGQASPAMSPQEFLIEPLIRYETAVMVRRGHPREACRSIHDLLDQDWLLNYAADGRDGLMQEVFWKHGAQIDERRIVVAHSVMMSQMLVEQADMCTWIPKVLTMVQPFVDRTVLLELDEVFAPRDLSLIARRNGPLGSAVLCFIDCLTYAINRRYRSGKIEDRRIFETVELLK
ncbi:LysR substrate-binding domain-containing protein [Paracoccus sp. MKU1]|uniref:LysR substrate-binding domain-containing protein n=1 Tax=Paracoccus sp. MKU1 TaxID=1745182 RepID=UPI00071921CD|nr:LysR substrate-binding domain-containing protein [Paracoccus sp. MKU1]KRW97839.1 LysR family transcriptional regulator [Paracoccus sp. MKU1]